MVYKQTREEQYELDLIDLSEKIAKSIQQVKGPSIKVLIVSGLARKCQSHCEIALNLVEANATAESIIVLRAAFEAMVLAVYLWENPQDIGRYMGFSALTTLRNQLEVMKILSESGEPFDGEEEQNDCIQRQRRKIIDNGYHTVFNLTEDNLDSWEAVKKVTNRAHFLHFSDLVIKIAKTEFTKPLLTTGFKAYNLASQMTHSQGEMMTSMIYFDANHPLFSEHDVYLQILILTNLYARLLYYSGFISESDFITINVMAAAILKKHGKT